ncbi:MAG: AMP-binding protein [Syntrophorhabdales bacterium]
MEPRWYKVWPVWAPKELDVEKPPSEYLREWADYTPDRIALSFYGKDITYSELNNMIDSLAWSLVRLGVAKGDRVAIQMENCPQFVISYFAALRAGGVVVAVNPMLKATEIEYELNDAGAETLIAADSVYSETEKVRGRTKLKNVVLTSMADFLPAEPVLPFPGETRGERISFAETMGFMGLLEKSPDKPICNVNDLKTDLAVLQYTGGTTGTPKGAMISHHALASALLGTMYWFHDREDDVFLGVTPFFHVMGQVTLMGAPLVSGGQVVILSRFEPKVAAQAIERYKVTYWVAATPMIIGLLSLPDVKRYDFSSFRNITTGGAPIPVELQRELAVAAPRAVITEGYGLSETIVQGGAVTPMYQHRPGYVGVPGPGSDIKIVDRETGTELGPNEEGEIIIKSPAMMLGYWNNPEESKAVLRNGWLYTGDTGLMDEDGYLKLLGRTRELIKCSGYSVFPADVEDLLFKHPAVRESAVIGVADPYRGESVKAFIVLKDEYEGRITETELLDWSKENMAAYKRPTFIEFRRELPKSAAGKLLRRILVEEERQRSERKKAENTKGQESGRPM